MKKLDARKKGGIGTMQTLDLDKLRQDFNSSSGAVRLVTVYSPT